MNLKRRPECKSAVADRKTEEQIVAVLLGIIELLAQSVEMMEKMIEKPVFMDDGTSKRRFRFTNPDALVFQVLMCARISSGLRAAAILLMNAQTTEVGVLFRTIDDFIANINFADELIDKGPENVTVAQREFLETYFVDDKRTSEELLEPRKKINYNALRQKVQAAEARVFGDGNPDRTKKMVNAIDDVFSGVVHGGYSSVMEMYGGESLEKACFNTRGVPVRFPEYRHHLGLYVQSALNAFFKVSHNFGHTELATHLIQLRRKFETSPAFTIK
jgi:hypothetical protein